MALSPSEDPTIRFEWQKGDVHRRKSAIDKRRVELLDTDLENDDALRDEWLALVQERNLIAFEEQEALKLPKLSGWINKQGPSFPRPWRSRWMEYDDQSGLLCVFKGKDDRKPLAGISLVEVEKIQPEGAADSARFQLVLPSVTWHLEAQDFEAMVKWMDELRVRQSHLKTQALQPQQAARSAFDVDHQAVETASSAPGLEGPLHLVAVGEARRQLEQLMVEEESDNDGKADEELSTANEELKGKLRELTAQRRQDLERMQKLEDETSQLRELVGQQKLEIKSKSEMILLMQGDLVSAEREIGLKDQTVRELQQQLQVERQARQREQSLGLSPEELQTRLAWSQLNLSHTRALLNLYQGRVAAAMECVALYRAIADGLSGTEKQREDIWCSQLNDAQQALQSSESQSEVLQEQLHDLQLKLRSA